MKSLVVGALPVGVGGHLVDMIRTATIVGATVEGRDPKTTRSGKP